MAADAPSPIELFHLEAAVDLLVGPRRRGVPWFQQRQLEVARRIAARLAQAGPVTGPAAALVDLILRTPDPAYLSHGHRSQDSRRADPATPRSAPLAPPRRRAARRRRLGAGKPAG